MSIYEVNSLVKGADRAALKRACARDALQMLWALHSEVSKSIQALMSDWGNLDYRDGTPEKVAALSQRQNTEMPAAIASLGAVAASMKEPADDAELNARFAQTTDGKLLSQAWKALIDGDTETLIRMNGYAENPLSNSRIAQVLFWKLVQDAGIKIGSDGSGGGAFKGDYRSSMNFMIDGVGLRVAYQHVFDREAKFDEKTFTASVVNGSFENNGMFRVVGEPNVDPESVKKMAAAVSQKLRDFYAPAV